MPCFDVYARLNGTVEETDVVQVFPAFVDIRSAGGSLKEGVEAGGGT